MNGINHGQEGARKPMNLCPVCLRKLQLCIGFKHSERYRQLSELTCREYHKFLQSAQWFQMRSEKCVRARV